MLTVEEIKKFIQADASSPKKQRAKVGLRYYEAEHDIKNYRVFFVDSEGKLAEDKLKSNIRICHPYFKLLVDQQTQYLLSGKGSKIKSDIPELQAELDSYFNDNETFMSELYESIQGAIIKGWEYIYAYKDEDGKTAFQCADSIGVVEVRAKETEDKNDYIIYWYIDRKDDKKIKRIQVWDKSRTIFYRQIEDGKIEPDDEVEPNPRPHILYKKDGDSNTYYDDYGLIPFFRLDNGKKQISGLQGVKDLIDDYDLMNAGLSNNIQDTNEALYIVKGFEGDNLDELMLNIKAKKHIGVSEDGGVDIKTVDIPVEARKAKMEIDEKNIFHFGMGVNTNALKDTSATTSIAIKSAYANLDLKCEGFLPFLKQFMRQLLTLVLAEINKEKGADYDQSDVYFDFGREIIINALESAQIDLIDAQRRSTEITTILNLANTIDNETKLKLIAEQLDIDAENLILKAPTDEDLTEAIKKALAE